MSMTTCVMVEPETAVQLLDCGEKAELCDSRGVVLGTFQPTVSKDPADYAWLRAQVSDEEIAKRIEKADGRTTVEVYSQLLKLASEKLGPGPISARS